MRPPVKTVPAPNHQEARQDRYPNPMTEKEHHQVSASMGARGNQQSHRPPAREQLTVGELCAELKVARRTFYEWRAKGRAPKSLKLPNGELRIRRADFERWLTAREEV
jgi:excisionase family DNA binding protein